ncbi:MAG TPA: hypothetical protein PLV22_05720, partial [Candidatus Cloacimonadota bacterium]|nr:hypothetical protein [Candidatus Cloacimonadota bacterium]
LRLFYVLNKALTTSSKLSFFENYFYLNQQMPTTSGFRDDFFSYRNYLQLSQINYISFLCSQL